MEIDNDPLTLEEWLVSTQEIRTRLTDYSKEPLPSDAGERHVDFNTAIQNSAECGNLLADAETYLVQGKAQATLDVKTALEYSELSADERKNIVKNKVAKLQRLVDGISVVHRAIRDRIYTGQNENRAGR